MKSEIFDETGGAISSKNNLKGLRFESENNCSPFGCHVSHTDDNKDFFSFPEFELQDNTYFFETSREDVEAEYCEVCINMSDSFKHNFAMFYFGRSALEKYNAQIRCNILKKEQDETIQNGQVAEKRVNDLVRFLFDNKSSAKPVDELIEEWKRTNKPNE